jgi:hypothetical protein
MLILHFGHSGGKALGEIFTGIDPSLAIWFGDYVRELRRFSGRGAYRALIQARRLGFSLNLHDVAPRFLAR